MGSISVSLPLIPLDDIGTSIRLIYSYKIHIVLQLRPELDKIRIKFFSRQMHRHLHIGRRIVVLGHGSIPGQHVIVVVAGVTCAQLGRQVLTAAQLTEINCISCQRLISQRHQGIFQIIVISVVNGPFIPVPDLIAPNRLLSKPGIGAAVNLDIIPEHRAHRRVKEQLRRPDIGDIRVVPLVIHTGHLGKVVARRVLITIEYRRLDQLEAFLNLLIGVPV